MSSSRNNGRYRNGNNGRRGMNSQNNNGPSQKKQMKDYSNEWSETIRLASQTLLNHHSTMDDLNRSLNFLNGLEAQLLVKERKWHYPPNVLPPIWDMNANGNSPMPTPSTYNNQSGIYTSNAGINPTTGTSTGSGGPPSTIVVTPSSTHSTKMSTGNRYALFQDDDDDEDDDEEENDSDDDTLLDATIVDDEAGDQITFHPQQPVDSSKGKQPYIQGMDMRRIMIRIYNAQSDIFAAQAYICRKQVPPEWSSGANKYSHCLHKIHSALILADSEISRWMSYTRNSNLPDQSLNTNRIIQLLMEDANIIEIAVQSMTTNRDHYMNAAKQVEAMLLQKLQPQWQSRDEVKRKIGNDRWKNNPHPKQNYALLRLDYERQLKDIRTALQCLNELDTTTVVESSKQLRDKIHVGHHDESFQQSIPSDMTQATATNSTSTTFGSNNSVQQQRYNGLRPTDLSRRVDIQLYPDPTVYGWTFTGSSGVTEFFEKQDIKLDWYYTTATVKTSLDHPVQGKTQLFASRVNPEVYRAILENPRIHTGKRYQRRGGNPNRH
jgi:hypothetical protein